MRVWLKEAVGKTLRADEQKPHIWAGLSRQSYWHMARTYATQLGMTDDWLKKLGVLSIRDLWIAFHYPAQHRAVR